MQSIVKLMGRELNRGALSGHQWNEFMLKLETAGLEYELAQRVIESKGNVLARQVVDLIANGGLERADVIREIGSQYGQRHRLSP